MSNICSINTLLTISWILILCWTTSCVEGSSYALMKRQNGLSKINNNNRNQTNTQKSSSNGGIYFSDIPISDSEGSADGPDDDLDDNASGKGEDDEDSKPIIEGSGKEPTGSRPGFDDEESDLDIGSGDEESLFISSTERPTKRPEVTKEPVIHGLSPVTTPQEPKEIDVQPTKVKDPIPDPIEENRVPIDSRPDETSTRFTIQSSTQWSHDRDDRYDDSNSLGNDVVSILGQKQVTPASFFARPGILAAVIGGAVVGLLCAILLVMFIVYRMRKKDEGSYALDEHKRSSSSANPYARGASKELYA